MSDLIKFLKLLVSFRRIFFPSDFNEFWLRFHCHFGLRQMKWGLQVRLLYDSKHKDENMFAAYLSNSIYTFCILLLNMWRILCVFSYFLTKWADPHPPVEDRMVWPRMIVAMPLDGPLDTLSTEWLDGLWYICFLCRFYHILSMTFLRRRIDFSSANAGDGKKTS